MWIIPSFNEIEHSRLGLVLCSVAMSIEELAFERGEETLTKGVVPAVPA